MRKAALVAAALIAALPFRDALAAGSDVCASLASAPSPKMAEYLANAQVAIAKLKQAAAGAKCAATGTGALASVTASAVADSKRFGQSVARASNELLDFSTFASGWRFYVAMPLRSPDAPEYVFRDNSLLERLQDRILAAGKQVAHKCGLSAPAGEMDLGNGKTWAPGGTAGEAFAELSKINGDVLTAYRNAVTGLGDRKVTKGAGTVVPDELATEITAQYGSAGQLCATEQKSFERLKEAFEKIGKSLKGTKNSTKNWTDAWAMLTKGATNEQERKILAKELSRQGITGRAADKMLDNLKKSNEAIAKSGLSGFLESFAGRVGDTFKEIGALPGKALEQVKDGFREGGKRWGKPADLAELSNGPSQLVAADEASFEIIADYMAAAQVARGGSESAKKSIEKLAAAHADLMVTVKALKDGQLAAEKLCFSQGKNLGGACAVKK